MASAGTPNASPPPPPDPVLNGESQAGTAIAVSIALVVLSSVFTGLRVYTRTSILGNFKADDWAICVAQLFAVIVSVLTILEVHYGLGKHFTTLQPDEVTSQLKTLYSVILTYNMGMNIVKVSFLLLYLRIFRSKTMRKITISFMIFVVVWAVVQAALLAFSCTPLSFFETSFAGRCLDTLPVWLFSSIMSTITDFAIFVIPLPSVIKLQLKLKKKVVTVMMFCLGFFTCAISIIRIFTLKAALSATDPSYENTGAACWSVVELNCAILCACLPTLRPLVVKFVPGWLHTDTYPSQYQMYAGRNPHSAAGAGVKTSTDADASSHGRDPPHCDVDRDSLDDLEASAGGASASHHHLSASTEQLQASSAAACYAARPAPTLGRRSSVVAASAAEKKKNTVSKGPPPTAESGILVTRETEVMSNVKDG